MEKLPVTQDPNERAETFSPVFPKNRNSMPLGSNFGAVAAPFATAFNPFVTAMFVQFLPFQIILSSAWTYCTVMFLKQIEKEGHGGLIVLFTSIAG